MRKFKFPALMTILLSIALLSLTSCSSLDKKEVKRLPMKGPSILKMLANGNTDGYENAVNTTGLIEVNDPAVICLLKEQIIIDKELKNVICTNKKTAD